jgi:hypothetical protein
MTFKSLWALGICVAISLGPPGILNVSGQEHSENQEYCWRLRDEVPAPIKKSVNAWVGECNTRLETLIKNLREWDEARIIKELPNIKESFLHTYLKSPIFEMNEGDIFGWDEVILKLDAIADKDPDIRIGPVEVEAILLPYGAKTGNDLRLNIKTHLILGSEDPGLRGCGIHRTSCTPIECQ